MTARDAASKWFAHINAMKEKTDIDRLDELKVLIKLSLIRNISNVPEVKALLEQHGFQFNDAPVEILLPPIINWDKLESDLSNMATSDEMEAPRGENLIYLYINSW